MEGGKVADNLQIPVSILKPVDKEGLREFLDIEPNTLEYYNGQGLPRFKIGNEIRYFIPDVLDWFRQRGILGKLKEEFSYEAQASR